MRWCIQLVLASMLGCVSGSVRRRKGTAAADHQAPLQTVRDVKVEPISPEKRRRNRAGVEAEYESLHTAIEELRSRMTGETSEADKKQLTALITRVAKITEELEQLRLLNKADSSGCSPGATREGETCIVS